MNFLKPVGILTGLVVPVLKSQIGHNR